MYHGEVTDLNPADPRDPVNLHAMPKPLTMAENLACKIACARTFSDRAIQQMEYDNMELIDFESVQRQLGIGAAFLLDAQSLAKTMDALNYDATEDPAYTSRTERRPEQPPEGPAEAKGGDS